MTRAVAGNLILGTILKALVLFILWKKRNWLISILTANRVTSVAQNWVHKLPQLNTQGLVNELEYEGEEGKATRMSWMQKGNWKNWLKNKSRSSTQVPTPAPAPVSDFGTGNSEGSVSPDESIEMVPKPIQRPDFEADTPIREEEVPGLRNKIPPQSEHEVERVEELLENEQRNPVPRPLTPYQPAPEVLKEEPSPPQVRPPVVEPEEVEERLDKTRKKIESSPPKQEVKRPIEQPHEISEPKPIPEVRKPIVRPSSKVEDSPFSEPEIKTDRENLFVPEVKFRNRFRR